MILRFRCACKVHQVCRGHLTKKRTSRNSRNQGRKTHEADIWKKTQNRLSGPTDGSVYFEANAKPSRWRWRRRRRTESPLVSETHGRTFLSIVLSVFISFSPCCNLYTIPFCTRVSLYFDFLTYPLFPC